ncbi:MAG TPA: hypothetical protein VGQ83_33835 [Polyangia bacterium]|jgi:hypothetical protein
MERVLAGVIDADPIVLGVTVALLAVVGAVWTVRRLQERRR